MKAANCPNCGEPDLKLFDFTDSSFFCSSCEESTSVDRLRDVILQYVYLLRLAYTVKKAELTEPVNIEEFLD